MSRAAPFTVLIPARLASTRLPNKPLADIAGQMAEAIKRVDKARLPKSKGAKP